jgi:dATP pyrophosphohydrolase
MTEVATKLIDLHVMCWKEGKPQYLIMQRSPGEIYEGVWQGVTGKIRTGEQAWQTALRELREETGMQPLHLWTVDHVNMFYEPATDTLNCIPVFGVEVAFSEPVLSKEHQSYRWCSVDEAVDLLLWDQQKRGLWAFHTMLITSQAKLRWMAIDIDMKSHE